MIESSMSQFVASFEQIRWGVLFDSVDVYSVVDFLLNSYRTLIDIHFPLKKVRIRGNSDYPVRWFNAELRKMRNTVEAMRLVYTVTGDAVDKTAYDAFRKVYRNAIQTTKKRAYASFIKDSSHKSRDIWRIINFEGNRNARVNPVDMDVDELNHFFVTFADNLEGNRNARVNPVDMDVDELNHFFVTFADNLVSSLTGSNVDALDYLKYVPKPVNSFCLLSVTSIGVSHAIGTLSFSKSSDIYGINSDIVRNTRDFLIDPLVYLINLSFRTGRFPRAFKNSKVVPIFKKGDSAEPKNYRPISVLGIFGKIIEIILKEHLLGYFRSFSQVTQLTRYSLEAFHK
ncbi:hypothetical protein QE152_g32179 [Popillia japonica]|uniref:Uncharacterized protein n=1 Tax=Popillia japonica TaxID=7064 RepID=A0AAW1J0A4_POPJA